MKFAIMQNKCPSCGGSLFSKDDMNLISLIQSKVAQQRFSSRLTADITQDLSLFIFNELKTGDLSKYIVTQKPSEKIEAAHKISDIDDIRKEIEAEFQEHINILKDEDEDESDEYEKYNEGEEEDEDDEEVDDDVFNKSHKLKKILEQKNIQNPNFGRKIQQPGSLSSERAKSGPKVNRIT
jgi:hypothetical protein